MNKAELITLIAKKSGTTQAVATTALEATLDSIKEGLIGGETVTLVGFGIFTPKRTSKRMGRNPKSGEPAVIPAKNTVSFKLSKSMKDTLNP